MHGLIPEWLESGYLAIKAAQLCALASMRESVDSIFLWIAGMGEDIEHRGEYKEIDRHRSLVFTLGVPKYSAEFSRVKVSLAPAVRHCLLELTDEGTPSEWVEATRQKAGPSFLIAYPW